ncbi:MAG: hypothetical protein RMI91_11460 [Gemmatales bacterium]|nr:hypothetical protein [Gemmatales bacterium]MDW7995261.1 hypothetical protein [Gemmatales bacterium]
MVDSTKRWLLVTGVVVALSGMLQAQEKPPSSENPPAPGKPAIPLSELPFPANQIIVVTDDLRKALERMPVRWILLAPETYRELLRQAERPPGEEAAATRVFAECHYRGIVSPPSAEGGRTILHLSLRLVFVTHQPGQKIELGWKRARLTRAELDGQVVGWISSETGLALRVAQPGRHELILETPLAVSYDPTQRQYVATLEEAPSAAVTTLELYLPGRVSVAQVAGVGPVEAKYGEYILPSELNQDGVKFRGTRVWAAALGTVRKLELSWQYADSAQSGPAGVLEGRLEVTVRERIVETEARLSLTWHRGSLTQLRFRLAPSCTQIFWADENRTAWNPLRADAQGTVLLKLPAPMPGGSAPWTGYLRWQQNLPDKGPARILVGRLELIEPAECQQMGTIEIRNPDQRALSFSGNATQVEANRFRYWFQPTHLELRLDETTPLPPVLEAQTQYQITVTPTAVILRSDWQIHRAVRANLQELVFSWPEGLELDRRGLPANLLIDHPQSGQVRVRLASGSSFPRHLTLEGWWPLRGDRQEPGSGAAAGSQDLLLALPWLLTASGEQGNQQVAFQVYLLAATVQFPVSREGVWDLALGPRTRGLLAPGGQKIVATVPLHLPAELRWNPHQSETGILLELSWRPRRATARWEGRLYLTRESWRLDQTLQLQFFGAPPATLILQLPPELRDLQNVRVRFLNQDNPASPPREDWVRLYELPGQSSDPLQRYIALSPHLGPRCQLLFSYVGELPRDKPLPQSLHIPVVLPDRSEVDLQQGQLECWHTTDLSVALPSHLSWQRAASMAPEELSVPDLTLVSSAWDQPLVVEIRAAAGQLCYADRAVVLLAYHPSQGFGIVTEKYWLTRLSTNQLSCRLPRGAQLVEVKVNGQVVSPEGNAVQEGQPYWHLRIEPAALAKPILLEVTYRLSVPWSILVELAPSRWQPEIEIGLTRWGLELPHTWRPVYVRTSATAEQAWTWRVDDWRFWNWWQFPVQSNARDRLEHWLTTGREHVSQESILGTWYTWQQPGMLDEIQVIVMAWQMWMLVCSFLAVALGAVWLYGPRWSRRTSLGLVLALLAALAVFNTWTFLTLLAGAWPGMLVSAAFVAVIELQRWWWEKRLEWLAGFAPVPPGSTIQNVPAAAVAAQVRSTNPPAAAPSPSAAQAQLKPPSTQAPTLSENPRQP